MDASEEIQKTLGGYVIKLIQASAHIAKQDIRIKELEVQLKEAQDGSSKLQDGVGRGPIVEQPSVSSTERRVRRSASK